MNVDRTNPFTDPRQDSWRSACHEPLPTPAELLDGGGIVQDDEPLPERSPSPAA